MIVTVAALVAAAINLQQQSKFHLPDDGVSWLERSQPDGRIAVVAVQVTPGGPGERAGIRIGDQIVSVAGFQVHRALDVTAVLARLGPWKTAKYEVRHDRVEVALDLIVGEATRDPALYYQYAVGAVYLAIGLFVYFRRGNATHSLHFFLLCLASFIGSAFHYSGKLNNFDKVIYLGNVLAGFLAPTLFLHFACVFPERMKLLRTRWAAALLYFPGLVMLVLHLGIVSERITTAAPLLEVRWLLDRVWLAFFCLLYLTGAMVLVWQKRRAVDPITRKQLSWLSRGAVAGILPFGLFYALPYISGTAPVALMNLAVMSLVLIPLTWAYAILRYRLMDVDVIFQEGYVYTLAALSVLGIFYGLIFAASKSGDLSGTTLVALILIAAFVFQPIRKWIQEQLDRYYFYKDRYDYRRTLIEFVRELSSPGNLDQMLESVADRLIRTLGIRDVVFFIWDDTAQAFRPVFAADRHGSRTDELNQDLDLSYLERNPNKPHLFFERTRNLVDVVSRHLPSSARQAIAELDLTYYLPCAARGRTIAYLGASRTEAGDFLSSDDVQLLVTLSGYVGIAIDNSLLYRSLEDKVEEYERLKEYSENIVESIHVGILAADLDGRVESWNSQIERLTGITRGQAVGKNLADLLPSDLSHALKSAPKGTGIHNIYQFVLRPDGMPAATVNLAVAPLFSREGAHIGRLIIFEDVTDRAELERRLVQADKLSSVGLLAAGVAHEVNTPLAVISTYAQMLAKQIAGDAQKAPLLEKIARQTFRASEIVNSLLNFSRTSTTEFSSVDLNQTIQETLGLIGHQFDKNSIQVETFPHTTLPRIRGNAGRLQQVFLNLFLNARDAMPGGGHLTVRTMPAGDGLVQVEVQDSGIGIAPDDLQRIFDPFFTTKVPTNSANGGLRSGTGLGLSVSYGIVQEHGGDISVQSQPGQGTTFTLVFPRLQVPARQDRSIVSGIGKESPAKEAAVRQKLSSEPVVAAVPGGDVAASQ